MLGPRGWYCFGTYGSDGAAIFVAPHPVQSADVMSSSWAAGAGPAIEMTISTGDTSGRFTVAKVIARLFPAHQAFVQQVVAENLEPGDHFPAGPFASDKVTLRSDFVAEYETAPSSQGMGTTFSRLTADATPIDGAAVLQGMMPRFCLPGGAPEPRPSGADPADRAAVRSRRRGAGAGPGGERHAARRRCDHEPGDA